MRIAASTSSSVRSSDNNPSGDLGSVAWQLMLRTPEMKRLSPERRAMVKRYFDTLSLNESTPVTLKSLLETQKAFVVWMNTHGLMNAKSLVLPAKIDSILRDIPGYLRKRDLPEWIVVATRVSYTQLLDYKAGKLTLGDMCRQEPWALFNLDQP